MDKKEILNRAIENLKLPKGRSNDEVWKELQIKIEKSEVSNIRQLNPSRLLRRAMPFVAAASVALLVMFFLPGNDEIRSHYSTTFKEFKTIDLSDGSQVKLFPNSIMDVDYGKGERIVRLDGEGFFNVEKGVPFNVITPNGQVSVLGTSFNVNSRKSGIDVKCFTGKVKVETSSNSATLTKGEGVNSNAADIYLHTSVFKLTDEGGLIFDQQPLNLVLEDLYHYKDFKITNLSSENPVISLEVLNETLSNVSEILAKITGLEVNVVGEKESELY